MSLPKYLEGFHNAGDRHSALLGHLSPAEYEESRLCGDGANQDGY
jgi:hypothetical protein